jgi:hypothetical protein
MNKISSELGDIRNTFSRRGNPDHGPGRMKGDITYPAVLSHKMME